ncbi:MAG: hypothetical protein ABIH25_03820 [Candidatus Woesearchaeota archaeon]
MNDKELITDGKKVLSKVMRILRKDSLKNLEPKSGYFMIPSDVGGPEQPLFWIPTQGCSYAKSDSGGCTMCNFGGSLERFTDEFLLEQFIDMLENPIIKSSTVLNYGGQGSFFDEKEHSRWLREKILEEVAKRDWVNVFVCESRPEYATRDKIRHMREVLEDKIIEVGVGVESTNQLVREGIINKNFNENTYNSLLDYARGYDIEVSLNVMFKPNLLTESEAISDSVNTIRQLLEGVSEDDPIKRIVLMMINIKPGTLVEWAYRKGYYESPLLWSGIEVLSRLTQREREFVKVLGFDTGVSPLGYISNNDKTTEEVREALKDFSRNHEIKPLLKLREIYGDSPSYLLWENKMSRPQFNGEFPGQEMEPLKRRLVNFYRLLEKEFNLKPYIF